MQGISTQTYLLAKTALISTFLSVSMVAGLLYIGREYIAHYILPASEGEAGTINAAFDDGEKEGQLVDMIAQAEPAVVSVVVTKDVPIYEQYVETLDPWGFFSIPRMRTNGTKEQEVGGGSGFVVSTDGMIVTNRHVVADTDARYSIIFSDGTQYDVDVLARDELLDIAILKVSEPIDKALPYLSFGSSRDLKLGQTVVAIGNALAEFQNSVSVGVVSGLSRTIVASDRSTGRSEQLSQVIQTDAAINPGNSGGPLLNLQGEVIGVNVATSERAENIGFALPSQVVEQVVNSVKEYGSIVRPYLGVRYSMVTPQMAEQDALGVAYGALIATPQSSEGPAVVPGSPADKAGIKEGDIILSLDGVSLAETDLATELREKRVGQEVRLLVWREQSEREIIVTLEEAP